MTWREHYQGEDETLNIPNTSRRAFLSGMGRALSHNLASVLSFSACLGVMRDAPEGRDIYFSNLSTGIKAVFLNAGCMSQARLTSPWNSFEH